MRALKIKPLKTSHQFIYGGRLSFVKININFLNALVKNLYYTNILEQYSKILINSNKIIKNKLK